MSNVSDIEAKAFRQEIELLKRLQGKKGIVKLIDYEERMKKRVREAQKEAVRRGEGETVNKEYFYPKKLFRDILKEYKNKDLNIKEDEQLNEIDRILKLQSDKVSSVPQVTEDRAFAELTTPPLPNTPMPVVQTAALPGTNTNLTRTQQALLSPEEQVIASRRT